MGGRAARKGSHFNMFLIPERTRHHAYTSEKHFDLERRREGGVEGRPSWNKKAKVRGEGERRPLVDL